MVYKKEDRNYIKIPEFGQDQYYRRTWTVKYKIEGLWYKKVFFSYEDAYNFYVKQLVELRKQATYQKTR